MLQDKRAEEEGGKEGNRPSQIGQVKGEHKDNTGAVRWGIEGSLAAGEGAEAACSGAPSRGAALTQLGRGQNTGGTTRAVQPVFSRTLPQALPEASSGVSPSQRAPRLLRSE